jgi:steroid 5-alpha reductase family enzyme
VAEILTLVGLNLLGLLAVILVLWRYACAIRDASFIDAFWAFGMVLLALGTVLQVGTGGQRGLLLFALTALWGLRLSWHLYVRWRAHGEDPRYIKIIGSPMEKNGWSWERTALQVVFLLQMPLLFITCLPAQIGIYASAQDGGVIGPLAIVGAVVALIGIGFETIGDAQLKAFRADPANKGKVLDTGLWRYTRHPNYFGDAATWWGLWLIAADAGLLVALASVIGPVFLTFTLTRWSGKALLEKGLKKTRPEYLAYIERTSGFFPWPPKRG